MVLLSSGSLSRDTVALHVLLSTRRLTKQYVNASQWSSVISRLFVIGKRSNSCWSSLWQPILHPLMNTMPGYCCWEVTCSKLGSVATCLHVSKRTSAISHAFVFQPTLLLHQKLPSYCSMLSGYKGMSCTSSRRVTWFRQGRLPRNADVQTIRLKLHVDQICP